MGRAEDNTVVLARPQVSKHHVEVRLDGGQVLVRDLGSLNGSFVNGIRLQGEQRLQAGDRLTVDTVDLPWESWFPQPRPAAPVRPRQEPRRGEREDIRRRVEEKLARLKEMIGNK